MKILAVIVTFNEQNEHFPPYLLRNLEGWLAQDIDADIDIVISDNVSQKKFRRQIKDFCVTRSTDRIKFHYIYRKEHEPTFICMNLGFRLLAGKKDYDYFVYSSDDTIMKRTIDLAAVLETYSLKSDAGIVSGMVNKDNATMCYTYLMDRGDRSPLKIKIGTCANLHFMVFSKFFMEKYNYRYPDILSAYASETLLTFLCKAIRKEWYLCRKVKLENGKILKRYPKAMRMRGQKYKAIGFTGYGVYKGCRTFDQIFKDGMKLGLGFDEWRHKHEMPVHRKRSPNRFWYLHNTACYDKRRRCRDADSLYRYIIDHLYVPPSVFDYDAVIQEIVDKQGIPLEDR